MLETINNLYYQIQKYNNDDLINEYLMLLAIYNINILNYLFFEIHNFVFDEKKYRNELIRIHQDKFRNELINLYKGCIITGVSNFQACHIIPFCNSDYNDKYDKYGYVHRERTECLECNSSNTSASSQNCQIRYQ